MRINFIPQQIIKFQISQVTKKNKGQKMKLSNKERIKKVLEIRRSNAATPIPSKKIYKRKRKHKNKFS